MAAQLTTNISWDDFDTETAVITRSVASVTLPVVYSTLTVYSGPCDFQNPGGAQLVYNPAGPVDSTNANLTIEPDLTTYPGTGYPAIDVDDIVNVAGSVFAVANTTVWGMAPAHLEVTLKRGPSTYTKA